MYENDEELYKSIGNNIKKYRLRNNITQLDLAEKCKVSNSLITKLESSKCSKSVSISILNTISKALNVDLKDLLSEEN